MKAFYSLTLLFCCLLPFRGLGQAEVQCQFTLVGFQPEEGSASFLDNSLTGELKTYRFQVKADGTARFILPVERPSYVQFQLEEVVFIAWLSPDDVLEAHIHAEGRVQFIRPIPSDQLFLSEIRSPKLQNTWLFAYPEDRSLIAPDLAAQIASNDLIAHINTCKHWAKLDRAVQAKIKDQQLSYQLKHGILARRAADQLAFFLTPFPSADPGRITQTIRDHGILDFIPMNDQYLVDNADYMRFLSMYLQVERLKQPADGRTHWLAITDLIDQRFEGKIRNRLLGRLCVEAFRTGEAEGLEYAFRKLYQLAPNSEEVQYLDQLVGESIRFDEEGLAPGFELPDPAGQMIALSDFEGQIVYLSVWATWCKPCLAGFEKSRYLREEMQKRGVVLVNISVDKEAHTWKQTMDRVPMPGINLHASNDAFMRAYNITALPVYHIINKNGKFTYLPEGSRNILEEFEKLVNN
ncbi:MAG: TlpA disulfide reductase family protein [Bacteroidota bacterium]